MRQITLLILNIFLISSGFASKSPHGALLKIDCKVCHNTSDWKKVNMDGFNHDKTSYPLIGQHKTVECRKCHKTLDFSIKKTDCSDCHVDIHQGTVGRDCDHCHTPNSWIVNNVTKIHREKGFALVGSHAVADCERCHTSASKLRFENINTDCYSCHKVQYEATKHRADGFNTECFTCHNMVGRDWSYSGNGFEHGFFALTGGHKINDCKKCHTNGTYRGTSAVCVSCHLDNYNATKNPAHAASGFSKDCQTCHGTVAWTPATFDHEKFFPIKTGKHSGINCTECHTNTANYSVFSCTNCHEHSQSRMNSQHDEVNDYVWNSTNCLHCHPKGRQ